MGFKPNSEGNWSGLCQLGIIIPQLLLTERKIGSDLLPDAGDSERIYGFQITADGCVQKLVICHVSGAGDPPV